MTYRTLLVIERDNVSAYTRNGYDWSDRYPSITARAAELPCRAAILDGEAIVQDERGASDFESFQLSKVFGQKSAFPPGRPSVEADFWMHICSCRRGLRKSQVFQGSSLQRVFGFEGNDWQVFKLLRETRPLSSESADRLALAFSRAARAFRKMETKPLWELLAKGELTVRAAYFTRTAEPGPTFNTRSGIACSACSPERRLMNVLGKRTKTFHAIGRQF